MEPADLISAIRSSAPYVHAHHGRVFVIAFGGETCRAPEFDQFIYDLALLHSFGVKLVLVHGARPQIDAAITERGLKPQFVGPLRVTEPAAMDAVRSAVGALRMNIEAKLSAGSASTPMGGASLKVAGGNWVVARPVGIRDGVDHQLTGEVRRIDIESIREVLNQRRIALLSPVGYSPTGEAFNLRAGDLAALLAAGLGADKLIYMLTSNPREWQLAEEAGDAGQLPLPVAQPRLQAALERHDGPEEDGVYVRAALAAASAGVRRVHLVGSQVAGGLLRELYTRDGCGLMIYADADYEATRAATVEDIGGILDLIRPLENKGVLVARSREQLELEIERFTVITRDGLVIACCVLLPFAESQSAEFACVAVHPDYRGAGRAGALLQQAEARARKLQLQRLFVLTTHSPHWFIEHGFRRGDIDQLPERRQALYNWQRNSLVLVKEL
jgi:amino-acid N-acetyltransferase